MVNKWYQEGAVYQIYPRSFKDSNNDGIGDLQGIIEKLDYIASLGVKTIWLSPIYMSPLDDNGYDISNYCDIHPDYGTLDDFKMLLSGVHKRDMKLIMDLVVNHTSDEHPWFIEAKSSKNNPYHDYYLWRDKPNNWTSFFGGKAWSYNQVTNEYYLHLFSPKQPDLNWENPKVREEIKKILRFWLDLGVDGFRCDVINLLSKVEGLPNGKKGFILVGKEHYLNGPKIHEYLQELKQEVFNHYDCFTVGECVFMTPQIALDYIADEKELNMLFQFDHMAVDNFYVKWFLRKFKPLRLKKALSKWQEAINGKGWNTLYFNNHDQPRSLSRFGNESNPYHSATFLATFLFFEQGTPFIYQGEEIGMTNAHFSTLEQYKDVETHNIYRIGRKIFGHKRMMKKIRYMSRDNARTPMQWDESAYAGFSQTTPWLEVNPNYQTINVKKNEAEPNSILNYYRQILKLRKELPVIVYGDFIEHEKKNKYLIFYERNYQDEQILVIGNYRNKATPLRININFDDYELILHNYQVSDHTLLLPYEARVYRRRKL
jgi:oligo-1,6-glucosidase